MHIFSDCVVGTEQECRVAKKKKYRYQGLASHHLSCFQWTEIQFFSCDDNQEIGNCVSHPTSRRHLIAVLPLLVVSFVVAGDAGECY